VRDQPLTERPSQMKRFFKLIDSLQLLRRLPNTLGKMNSANQTIR
jgi:hypothetical protein